MVDLRKITYEKLKNSPGLQKEISKKYHLEDLKPETFDNNTKYVYTGFDPDLMISDDKEPNIRLLKEIMNTEYKDWKVKPRNNCKGSKYRNLTKLQIGILIADMLGYRHYQMARILDISQDAVKKEAEKALLSIAKLTIGKCKTCKWKEKGKNSIKKDICKFWKIKTRNDNYCFLYKGVANGILND